MVNKNVNSWEFSKSTWVDFNVTAGYMWCNLLLRILQRFFKIRCACNISQQWASCPIARAKSKCKIRKSGSSNYSLYDVFHNYYQLKTDWEIRVPALFLIWNTICLTWFCHRSTHTKNVITHGISFWRFKNLNLISGMYVWERFPKRWDWRLSHCFYASITLLFSLTIFLGRELKITRYTFFYLNFLTK